MTKFEEELECISCHEKRTQKQALNEGWFIIDYTHELLCEMCGITIPRFKKEYIN